MNWTASIAIDRLRRWIHAPGQSASACCNENWVLATLMNWSVRHAAPTKSRGGGLGFGAKTQA
jgi:hypothetical protein